jgi:hypothetical protein
VKKLDSENYDAHKSRRDEHKSEYLVLSRGPNGSLTMSRGDALHEPFEDEAQGEATRRRGSVPLSLSRVYLILRLFTHAGKGDAAALTTKRPNVQMPDEYLPPNKILFIQNLPESVTKDQLSNLFNQCAPTSSRLTALADSPPPDTRTCTRSGSSRRSGTSRSSSTSTTPARPSRRTRCTTSRSTARTRSRCARLVSLLLPSAHASHRSRLHAKHDEERSACSTPSMSVCMCCIIIERCRRKRVGVVRPRVTLVGRVELSLVFDSNVVLYLTSRVLCCLKTAGSLISCLLRVLWENDVLNPRSVAGEPVANRAVHSFDVRALASGLIVFVPGSLDEEIVEDSDRSGDSVYFEAAAEVDSPREGHGACSRSSFQVHWG